MKRLFFVLLILNTLFLSAQTSEVRNYQARKLTGAPPKIDGKLDEALWTEAWWENHFVQYEPYEGREPSQSTTFAVLYDENNLYVAMKMDDNSPDSIVQRLTRRDEIDGDVAGIIFDSYCDKRTGFAFAVTAAGVKYDYIISNDGEQEDNTWNPVWWVETSGDSLGWYAEMRIPLTQVRFNEADRQKWGFQAARYIFRKDEMSQWQPSTRKKAGYVSQFGTLSDINGIEPRNTFDVMPYVVARTERFDREADNPLKSKGHKEGFEGGVDAKIGITNYLTLDLTVNPDFGQVEADPSEVNLSTFETFFREQRPFFIEGKNILNFGLNFGDGDLADEGLFYSRRIGRKPHYVPETADDSYLEMPDFTRILGAAKISGKTKGGWSVGLLESATAKEYAQIKGNGLNEKIPAEPFSNYLVGRVQKDFNAGNTYLGGMITAVNRSLGDKELQFLHKSAYTGGIDFVHKWKNKKWEFDVSLYGSRVSGTPEAILNTQESWLHLFQRPDASHVSIDSTKTVLSGYGGKLLIGELDGSLKWMGAVAWKSPGLELNDVGYLRQADNVFQVFWLGYRMYEPISIFRELNINYNQWTQWNFEGDLIQPGMNINAHTTLKNYWWAGSGINWNGRVIDVSALRGGPAIKMPANINSWLAFGTNQQKEVTVEVEGSFLKSFEKSFESYKGMEIELSYRPYKSLKISLAPEYSYYQTELQYIDQFSSGNKKSYLFGTIRRNTVSTSLRVNFNLTPEISLQYWGQPFIATGKYSHFKRITNSMAGKYTERFSEYSAQQIIYDESKEEYLINDPELGSTFGFEQPDFNVRDFLSNLVFRWEYKPGSTLYLVWSQNRESSIKNGQFDLLNDLDHLFKINGKDIFLVKLSYRLGR